jgi:hypothetical protein
MTDRADRAEMIRLVLVLEQGDRVPHMLNIAAMAVVGAQEGPDSAAVSWVKTGTTPGQSQFF